MKKRILGSTIAGFLFALSAAAQNAETFKTRLAPVAIDVAMRANIAGSGLVTATLAGAKLTVSGTFEGLRSPATVAQIHQGSFAGVRGAAILDLTVSKAAAGSVSGSFNLTAEQIENLRKGKWYVQIDSERAAQGNLWGWLMK
jgi:hypothetical protein